MVEHDSRIGATILVWDRNRKKIKTIFSNAEYKFLQEKRAISDR